MLLKAFDYPFCQASPLARTPLLMPRQAPHVGLLTKKPARFECTVNLYAIMCVDVTLINNSYVLAGSRAKLHNLCSVVTVTSGINIKNQQRLIPELKCK